MYKDKSFRNACHKFFLYCSRHLIMMMIFYQTQVQVKPPDTKTNVESTDKVPLQDANFGIPSTTNFQNPGNRPKSLVIFKRQKTHEKFKWLQKEVKNRTNINQQCCRDCCSLPKSAYQGTKRKCEQPLNGDRRTAFVCKIFAYFLSSANFSSFVDKI